MSSPVQVGQPAPDFELRDQHGRPVSLSRSEGRPVLLVFYPFAFTGVCSAELLEIRDHHDRLRVGGAEVLALSCDPMFALRVYAEREGLHFPLLSDFWPHGAVASAYGVLDEERGCPRRSSFVVGRDGRVAWSVHNPAGEARDLDRYVQVLTSVAAGQDTGR